MHLKGQVDHENLPQRGAKVKKLAKANVSEMSKKAPSRRVLRPSTGNTAFSPKDTAIYFFTG